MTEEEKEEMRETVEYEEDERPSETPKETIKRLMENYRPLNEEELKWCLYEVCRDLMNGEGYYDKARSKITKRYGKELSKYMVYCIERGGEPNDEEYEGSPKNGDELQEWYELGYQKATIELLTAIVGILSEPYKWVKENQGLGLRDFMLKNIRKDYLKWRSGDEDEDKEKEKNEDEA